MTRWRISAIAGLLAAGLTPAAMAATATVYYSTATKGWPTANIHHDASGSWTTVPGTPMTAACPGWLTTTVTFSATNFQAVFNNGANVWDNPTGGGNYTVPAGIHQVRNGAIVANAGNPCGATGDNAATVFYKPNTAWTTVNIHYAPTGGAWTAAPGVAMDTACTGWRKKVIPLGAATGLAVTFNNGSTWDNNGGRNYALGTGNQKVDAGAVTTGDPCAGLDATAPTTPAAPVKTASTVNSVSLSWTASTDNVGVTGYEVFRDGVSAGTATGTAFTASGLSASTTYAFTVRARDAEGNWSAQGPALSAPTSAPVVDTAAPSVPTGLSATTSGTSISVRWTASTDNVGVTGYTVTRTGGAGTVVLTTSGTSLADTGAAQTTYSYTVSAVDAAGNRSAASDAVGATTGQASAAGTPIGTDIREDAIYFVMTARFYDGDPANNRGGQFHVTSGNAANNDPMYRGDFKGLMQKLDYIKALGFSAVWITPVVLNRSDYDFHGYHGWDFMRVDPRLESAGASYQDLINAAHAKGIKIIQDVVYNHSSRWGEKNLQTPKVFGVRDAQWSWYYDEPVAGRVYDGITVADPMGKSYTGDLWSTTEPAGNTCRNWGVPTQFTSSQGYRIYNCQWPNPTTGMFRSDLYHQCWIGNWEGEDARSCWIHEDLADFNTESKPVQDYLKQVYRKYIGMGVDGFRIDTAVHIPRVTWNRHFLPDAHSFAEAAFGEKGKNFFMFGEVGSFVNDKWNRGSPNHSAQFFTWKERATYSADDTVAALEQFNYENNQGTGNQPTSNNAFLNGNAYRTPDHSKASGMSVIDMRMHMNFGDAGNAYWNGKDSDDSYNDATYNVVYVDSHDYGPNKSNTRYTGGTAAWAENMSLMWTFRGIPTLYYGSEIEFQAGKQIDCGPTCPLATTGRAYFGAHLEGSVTASDFGVVGSASGAVAATLEKPLVKHLQRLNQIRRKVPALQKGQYSTEGISGGIAYKRRFTDAAKGIDSFALVAVTSGATFSGIPNGTYKDAVTGDTKVVSAGVLTATVSGQGNARIYVLDLPGNLAPGKVGADGPFLKP
ncbi:carbohydrate binding domain-containing protein [Rhizobacter sp. Root1221]|uniref:carbohydrate binding domain-containing protein n=1 Tax=Rhizobacter sp. Root1221 TaxID=1736433 RepID=UPI0006F6D32A|nr:carbohydrate binding domain-containing protein [Rhizobacter sp. Root1221]KQV97251.1 alpha-amylase [Rhizobacter sp. Root1221]